MTVNIETFGIPPITVNGFFNEEETDLVNIVTSNGSGFYKITIPAQGSFSIIEKVTEIAEDNAILDPSLFDRILSSDENASYMYVNFAV